MQLAYATFALIVVVVGSCAEWLTCPIRRWIER